MINGKGKNDRNKKIRKEQKEYEKRQYEIKHEEFVHLLHPFIIGDQNLLGQKQLVLAQWIIDEDWTLGQDKSRQPDEILDGLIDGEILWFSIINLDMAKTDLRFFRGENFFYKPYLYGMYLVVNQKNRRFINSNRDAILRSVKESIPCRLNRLKTYTEGRENNEIDMTVVFSASPFRKSGSTIVFNITTDNEDERRELAELQALSNAIDGQWSGIKEDCVLTSPEIAYQGIQNVITRPCFSGNIRIYNVGQGFCAYFRNGSRFRMMIDFGGDKSYWSNSCKSLSSYQKEIVRRNYNAISRCIPHCVFLTHWDLDHILGICLFNRDELPDIWIAPDVSENERTEKFLCRLITYLHRRNNLIMIGALCNGQQVWSNEFFTIYKGNTGQRGRTKKNKKNNDQGLLLVLRTADEEKIIFPGDCGYTAWPSTLLPLDCTILIVPHHGGEAGNLSEISEPSSGCRNGIAIFSYGENNIYGHPDSSHVQCLERIGYQRVNLMDYSSIEINIENRFISNILFNP